MDEGKFIYSLKVNLMIREVVQSALTMQEETLRFLEGVREYGVGEWSTISSEKMSSSRNNVQLKDRFRVLQRKGLINEDGELIGSLD